MSSVEQLPLVPNEHPTPTVLVIDDFYEDPMAVREWVLQQDFPTKGNYPGQRSVPFALDALKEKIQNYVEPFAGKITQWSNSENEFNANGTFQFTLESDVSWMHTDNDVTDWAGVLYLTPDAPLSGGTGLFRFQDGTRFALESEDLTPHNQNAGNYHAWEQVDNIGNVFNRLILFNAQHWHRSLEYFGDSKENGRLFQTFFFSTERRLTHNIKKPVEASVEPESISPTPEIPDFNLIREEIRKRQPFAMQIDVHGVPTQHEDQIGTSVIDGQEINYGYHPLNLWESIHRPLIKDIEGKKVLDVGCNAGFFSFELAKRGADVLGVDVNQVERVYNLECMPLQQAEWIESQLQTGAKFKEMDYLDCDESEPYDKILFLGVYYHLEDPSRGLAKLNRLLKMGGELYVECETNPTETRYYPDDEIYRFDASNFLIPTPEYLNEDMERNGFEIVETFRTRDVCCGNRYAFRAVKVSDNPQPKNTFEGAKDSSEESFEFSPRKNYTLQNQLDELTRQVLHSDVSDEEITRLKSEIDNRGPFHHRIKMNGVYTKSIDNHPEPLWDSLQTVLSDMNGKTVLDVGCNAGFFSFEVAKQGAKVLGIDNNQGMEYDQDHSVLSAGHDTRKYGDWIDQANWIESELQTGAEFKIMDFYDCNDYGVYDAVLFLGVYYHLVKPSDGLRHLNRLLKMGGEIYLEAEVNMETTTYYEGAEEYLNDPSVFLVATPDYIKQDLTANGFTVVAETTPQVGVWPRQRQLIKAVKTEEMPLY